MAIEPTCEAEKTAAFDSLGSLGSSVGCSRPDRGSTDRPSGRSETISGLLVPLGSVPQLRSEYSACFDIAFPGADVHEHI